MPRPLGVTPMVPSAGLLVAVSPDGGETVVCTDWAWLVALAAPTCTVALPPGGTMICGLDRKPTTGWVPVVWRARVTSEDRVLVLGGTGTVGRVAAQAARLMGAQQVVAVGSRDLDRIGEEFGDEGFTVCIDPVWGEPLARALVHAAPHARVVHLGQSAGPEAPLRSADVRGKELTILGHSNFAMTKEERDRAYLELLEHVTAGRIAFELQTFGLEDVAAAWRNQRGGKSVVLV